MRARSHSSSSRRSFLKAVAATPLVSACGASAKGRSSSASGWDRSIRARFERVCSMRSEYAVARRGTGPAIQTTNGDEDRYDDRLASYSKGLPHNDAGAVDPAAYAALVKAIETARARDFATVPLAGSLKLSNPQAAFTYPLQGLDGCEIPLTPPPPFASAGAAADMGEVYWHAILRDVPFDGYDASEDAHEAAEDLSRFSAYAGPQSSGSVTPSVLFRGQTAGDVTGPYVSQFLYARVPQGVYSLDQRFRMPAPGVDYVTNHADWLQQQRGMQPLTDPVLDKEPRFIRTGRDLTRFVHRDFTFQAFLNAALILSSFGERCLSPTPYHKMLCSLDTKRVRLTTEEGFCTFGPPHVLGAVTAVANMALHACWYQKWVLHRRLRPEAFAHRVDVTVRGKQKYPVHTDLFSSAFPRFLKHDSLLLPLAYPEGAPAHPSYPAGHAAIAGACATVLKAFFREDVAFPGAVQPSPDGVALVPYGATRLTIGGELNKLASNVAIARNFAGIHYRSDANGGLQLGETVALAYLADVRRCVTEDFDGFALTKFDRTPAIV